MQIFSGGINALAQRCHFKGIKLGNAALDGSKAGNSQRRKPVCLSHSIGLLDHTSGVVRDGASVASALLAELADALLNEFLNFWIEIARVAVKLLFSREHTNVQSRSNEFSIVPPDGSCGGGLRTDDMIAEPWMTTGELLICNAFCKFWNNFAQSLGQPGICECDPALAFEIMDRSQDAPHEDNPTPLEGCQESEVDAGGSRCVVVRRWRRLSPPPAFAQQSNVLPCEIFNYRGFIEPA